MRFLVASERHELLPLHHRLRREGHETEALVWRSRYERAWDGSVKKLARHSDGTLNSDSLKATVEAATRGEAVVLTNVRRVAELFATAPRLFAAAPNLTPNTPHDRLLLGGWFDGESAQAPHLLVADWGAWTGGLGPAVLGGLTLVRLGHHSEAGAPAEVPAFIQGAVQAASQVLKSAGFRGLFHLDVEENAGTGELALRGLSAGWPWLHTEAFVAELENLGGVLTGEAPRLKHKFVTVLPVTTPPWPNEKQGKVDDGVEVKGLTPTQQGRLMWYDITVDLTARKLRTAGLDGLLAVATGASDSTPALARARALELATRLQVPGLQYRGDAGALVDPVLCTLEDRYSYVI